MKKLNNKMRFYSLAALASIFFLASCNKDLDQLDPLSTPSYPSAITTAGKTLAANPLDNIYYKFVQKAGLEASFDDVTKSFTLFATNNTGMRFFIDKYLASLPPPTTGPPIPVLGATVSDARYYDTLNKYMPNALATSIVNYNTTGYKNGFVDASTKIIPSVSPNKVFGSDLFLVATQPFLRVPFHVASGLPYSYVNNIPVNGIDQIVSNGVIHHTFTLVTPPSLTLRSVIAAEPTLSYFRAALLRADSGAVVKPGNDSANFLNYLVSLAVTNVTVLAPNDAAFQTLVFGLVYSQTLTATGSTAIATATANGAVAAGPAFLNTNNVSTTLIKGIVVYHILASTSTSGSTYLPDVRYFSVNVPSTPAFVKTLLNSAIAAHPGIKAQATYAGAIPTVVNFTGYGTFPPGGAPYSSSAASVVKADLNGVNGVLHIIDKVLLPQ
jgi:hypothetical protein